MLREFRHPEALAGEVFFTNAHQSDFRKMQFKTKRIGSNSYDGVGNKLTVDDWFPVFINKQELKVAGKSLKELRDDWYRVLEAKAK